MIFLVPGSLLIFWCFPPVISLNQSDFLAGFYSQSYLLAKVFSDDLLNLLHAALWSPAVEHLQRGCVLLGEQIVQSTNVLTHLDEGTSIGTA